ncbi:DUF2378 family protein [Corallococcus praedator]|uniref:DUF2378 family protein n=1 Tax=Corallococcus praedator TaxID=2316724 RepID=A0ABX9QMH9_9BACT|nr:MULTISPECIES: DUF2378 family protein [Corallococcus]RKH18476.1 DUF2378 family protein [Corallococcus sp. CA047B]RKH33007.1 DUF2378 family protein [Corallococcus sp. CA031C]RKI13552.1 DUF2378 family protein [Corallococcus praedator]
MSSQNEFVFGHTVEGLLLALQGRMDEPLRAKLKAAGLDLERKLEPAYPNAVWQRLLQLGAEELFPGVPMKEAQWLLGERFVEGYFETNMGRALKGVLKLLGPARALERTSRNLASGSNFLHVEVQKVSDTDFRIRVNEGGTYPEFIGAICHFGTMATGVKGLTTVVESRDGRAAIYRVRW